MFEDVADGDARSRRCWLKPDYSAYRVPRVQHSQSCNLQTHLCCNILKLSWELEHRAYVKHSQPTGCVQCHFLTFYINKLEESSVCGVFLRQIKTCFQCFDFHLRPQGRVYTPPIHLTFFLPAESNMAPYTEYSQVVTTDDGDYFDFEKLWHDISDWFLRTIRGLNHESTSTQS